MEEQKKVETMKGEDKKISYEKLAAIASQKEAENRQLVGRLRMVDNMMTRLNFLFKVMEHPDKFRESFVDACADEIEEMLTIPEEPEEETKK